MGSDRRPEGHIAIDNTAERNRILIQLECFTPSEERPG
jgi:hypothetical protein